MALRIKEIQTSVEVEHFLNGGVTGGPIDVREGRVFGLHGKTLILIAPAATVTFSDTSGAGLTLKQIHDQIQATAPTVRAKYDSGALLLILVTPATAVSVDKDGTANQILKFNSGADTTGKVYAKPGGSAPALVSIQPSPRGDTWAVIVEE